ncbi:MAG TPA: FAD-dependent oxidoreductase [Alphaproteobacteria bacterium]|nr:FAD-dependent oxidoreductase [Alphaproteobacteria bacterium]
MAETMEVDVCVIGAGSGGLSVAAGASQMGAKTVLIERGAMGGDCLNTGCVPSKALLAAGHAAHAIRTSARFGVNGVSPTIDFEKVHAHVHGVIGAIAPNDSVERFSGLGVQVIEAEGKFTGPREVVAGGMRIRAKRFVVATGSRAGVPPIEGLDTTPFLTNETIFERTAAPEHLVVIGGGPIGLEMAQAHRRLGARVTVLEMAAILANDDPELVDILRTLLRAEGIEIHEGVRVLKTGRKGNGITVTIEADGKQTTIEGSDLLVAAGRAPNVDGLDLEKAGIDYSRKGITTDARLRTSNKRVYALGDVAGGPQFTHIAGYHAGIAIRNMLFRLPAKVDYGAMPWVTYTAPELAHVGLSEAGARAKGEDVTILRWPFAENDRAQAERETDGLIKAITNKKGRILGATILGAHAGELILPWVLAVGNGMKIGKMAGMIAPYPTLGEVSKRAAGSYYMPKLFSERTRKIVRFLLKFG